MASAYSTDLRERVVLTIDEGASCHEATEVPHGDFDQVERNRRTVMVPRVLAAARLVALAAFPGNRASHLRG
jgi:hypothetical protein